MAYLDARTFCAPSEFKSLGGSGLRPPRGPRCALLRNAQKDGTGGPTHARHRGERPGASVETLRSKARMRCLFCGVEVQKPGPCEKCRQERTEKMVEEAARARAQAAQAAQARQAGATAGAPTPVETVAGPKPLPRLRRTALALGGLFLFD